MTPPKRLFTPKFMTDIEAAETLPSSMCFLDAWAARFYERISEEEYHRHVFAHLTGTVHKQDKTEDDIQLMKRHSRFEYSVWKCAKEIEEAGKQLKGKPGSILHVCLGPLTNGD